MKKTTMNSQLLIILLLVAQVVMLVGCDKDENTTSGSVQTETTEDRRKPESMDLPEIRTAMNTQKRIKDSCFQLCSISQEIDETITESIDCVTDEKINVLDENQAFELRQLIETVRCLRLTSHEILDQEEKYLDVIDDFEEAISTAPEELREAASLFEQFSQDSEFETFREDYLVMSSMFMKLADRAEVQYEQFGEEFSREDFIETMDYLRAGSEMLDRTESALRIAESVNQFPEIMNYLGKLQAFIRDFEELRNQMRRVNQLLDEPKPSSKRKSKSGGIDFDDYKNDDQVTMTFESDRDNA